MTIVYTIDGSDRITSVNPAWEAFAAANGGGHLLAPAVLDQPLWDYISEPTTALLYRRLTERVRQTGYPVELKLRCDSPDCRRFLRLKVQPEPDAGLRFEVATILEEARAPIPWLEPGAPRTVETVEMCAWCKQVLVGGDWCEVEVALADHALANRDMLPGITHGICPRCLADAEAALDQD